MHHIYNNNSKIINANNILGYVCVGIFDFLYNFNTFVINAICFRKKL